MSVFGGDSWAREAQYRKRRVEDVVVEGLDGASSFKKLSNGKYTCLLCPQRPILDSPLMFSVRHIILSLSLFSSLYFYHYLIIYFNFLELIFHCKEVGKPLH